MNPEETKRQNKAAYYAAYYAAHKEKWKDRERINAAELKRSRAARYMKNCDAVKQRSREYYAKHRDKMRMGMAAWAKSNIAKKKAIHAKWRAAHPDRMRLNGRRWRKANPEKAREIDRRRRAVELNASVGDQQTIVAWEKSWRRKRLLRCYWCERKFSPNYCHTDHIVALSRGGKHSVENLCVSCATCNITKGARKLADWNDRIESPVLSL